MPGKGVDISEQLRGPIGALPVFRQFDNKPDMRAFGRAADDKTNEPAYRGSLNSQGKK